MRLLDLFVFKYNRTDFHELNLDWLISDVRTLAETLQNFISLNTIKYADPIQWNITTQYEANTVVIDANDGTAYLSVQAVPSGVAITNTDYWMPIFTLNLLSANQNITLRDDGANVLSTFSSAVNDWLIWNGTLYKVTQAINTNEAYVVGYNITRYTVENFISDSVTSINNIIGELSDLNTTDKTSIVNAINELESEISSISSNLIYVNVKDYGAVGDGVTDDSTAIQAAIDAGTLIYFDTGVYTFKNVSITKDCIIKFKSDASITPVYKSTVKNTYYNMFSISDGVNVTFDGMHYDGQCNYPQTQTETNIPAESIINISDGSYVTVKNAKIHGVYLYNQLFNLPVNDRRGVIATVFDSHLILDSCEIYDIAYGEMIQGLCANYSSPVNTLEIKNCNYHDYSGYSICNFYGVRVSIHNNYVHDTTYTGSWFNAFALELECYNNDIHNSNYINFVDQYEAGQLLAFGVNADVHDNYFETNNTSCYAITTSSKYNSIHDNTVVGGSAFFVGMYSDTPTIGTTDKAEYNLSNNKCILDVYGLTYFNGLPIVFRATTANPISKVTLIGNEIIAKDNVTDEQAPIGLLNVDECKLLNNILISGQALSTGGTFATPIYIFSGDTKVISSGNIFKKSNSAVTNSYFAYSFTVNSNAYMYSNADIIETNGTVNASALNMSTSSIIDNYIEI